MTRTELQREYERICRDWISNEIRSAEDLDVLLHNYRILFAFVLFMFCNKHSAG